MVHSYNTWYGKLKKKSSKNSIQKCLYNEIQFFPQFRAYGSFNPALLVGISKYVFWVARLID